MAKHEQVYSFRRDGPGYSFAYTGSRKGEDRAVGLCSSDVEDLFYIGSANELEFVVVPNRPRGNDYHVLRRSPHDEDFWEVCELRPDPFDGDREILIPWPASKLLMRDFPNRDRLYLYCR